MSDIVIYGCGGLGLEVLACLLTVRADDPAVIERRIAFVDDAEGRIDDASAMLGACCRCTSQVEDLSPDAAFVVAIGDPALRERAFARCLARGLRPLSVVHGSACVDRSARLGDGVFIGPFGFVGPFARIGDNVVINNYASVGHDASVGRSSVLSPYATLNGHARCGERAFLGTHATVLPDTSLGAFSKLAAGGVLGGNTEDGALAVGNPARHRVMFRHPDSQESLRTP